MVAQHQQYRAVEILLLDRTQRFQAYSITLSARIVLAVNIVRECPPQTRSPAMNSQGFTGLPLVVASFRHVTVTHAGLSLPA
jgi:hypothetical protein